MAIGKLQPENFWGGHPSSRSIDNCMNYYLDHMCSISQTEYLRFAHIHEAIEAQGCQLNHSLLSMQHLSLRIMH